jgi:hypothetical protein
VIFIYLQLDEEKAEGLEPGRKAEAWGGVATTVADLSTTSLGIYNLLEMSQG